MAYNSLVPTTGHSGSQDYQAMQGNFAQIQSSFSVDHEPLASGGGIDGFHKKSSYVSSGSDPTAVASVGIVYSKTPTTHTELYYEGEAGTGKILQLTNQSLTTAAGEGFMTGGLQIRCGVAAILNGNSTQAVSWTAFPNGAISAVACPFGTNTLIQVSTPPTTTGVVFSRTGTSGVASFYYIAIGY